MDVADVHNIKLETHISIHWTDTPAPAKHSQYTVTTNKPFDQLVLNERKDSVHSTSCLFWCVVDGMKTRSNFIWVALLHSYGRNFAIIMRPVQLIFVFYQRN